MRPDPHASSQSVPHSLRLHSVHRFRLVLHSLRRALAGPPRRRRWHHRTQCVNLTTRNRVRFSYPFRGDACANRKPTVNNVQDAGNDSVFERRQEGQTCELVTLARIAILGRRNSTLNHGSIYRSSLLTTLMLLGIAAFRTMGGQIAGVGERTFKV